MSRHVEASMATLCLLAAVGAAAAAEPTPAAPGLTFTADTSHPDMSLFIPGERVDLTFAVGGLTPAENGLKLLLDTVDEHDRLLRHDERPVQPGPDGTWQTTLEAPHERLGFYRVRARLSNGLDLPKLGSRAAGSLTYAVVPDPARRPLYPSRETFFGMQGGFCPAVNVLPYLGIRWKLGGYSWRDLEPDRAGQVAENLAAYRQRAAHPPAWQVNGQPWTDYPLPCLFFAPKWAVTPDTAAYCTGTLTPEGEAAWVAYCTAAARAYAEDRPDLEERVYQITWEPVYPWGYKGTDEALVRIHELAYPAIHAADPRALVVGPTGAGISRNDVEWNANLLRKGLGRYLDALAIHPYHALPPERLGFVDRVRELKEVVRQLAGRPLELLGTEQGWPTGQDPAKELEQARGLLRQNLILFGEGFRLNFAFYIVDYPTEPGYGYFHNLRPTIPWGPDRTSPKPIAPAYAAQSFLLEGHRSCGAIEWLGETALGYAFERGEHVVLALWDWGDTPRPVSLPVGVDQVTLYDWMGNTRPLAAAAGQVSLTLGPEPQYVEGVAASLWGRAAKPPVRLAASRLTGHPGRPVTIQGEAGGTPGAESADRLSCEADPRLGLAEPVAPQTVPPGARQPFRFVLPVPADAEPGLYPLKVVLAGATGPVGVGGAMLAVQPPVVVRQVEPVFGPAGQPGLRLRLGNDMDTPAASALHVRLAGEPGTEQDGTLRLPARGEAETTLYWPEADPDPARSLTARLTVTTDGYRSTEERTVNFTAAARLPAAPDLDGSATGWGTARAIVLRGRDRLVRAPAEYRGADDLSATLRFAWDDRALYLAADVADDVFVQEGTGFDTWKGDCLQLGFDLDPGKAEAATGNLLAEAGQRHRAGELDFALTRNGPEVFRTISVDPATLPVRLLTPAEADLRVTREPGRLRYRAAIPWGTLGLATAPTAGDRLGIALAVNDMDDPKQAEPKALGLFGGITPAKDPRRFGVLVLGVAPSGPAAGAPPAFALQFAGQLGQSEAPGATPLPFIGTSGAAIAAGGRLWTFAGNQLLGFDRDAAGRRVCRERRTLPTWVVPPGVSWDGEFLWFAGGDGLLYAWSPAHADSSPVQAAKLPTGEGLRAFVAMAPELGKGYARKGRVYVLQGNRVLVSDTPPGGSPVALELPPLADPTCWYCAIGYEPASGDLLVGSYWPDAKVYRFTAAGTQVTTDGWPRPGHASGFAALGDQAWIIEQGGVCRPLTGGPGRPPAGPTFGGLGTMYASGLARDTDGSFWVSGSQGLVRFDRRGRATGERLGGVNGVRALAIAADGTLVAAVENGQRLLRFRLDDAPDAALACNANEPWRVGAGWTNRACSLAWTGQRFAVLDEVGQQVWIFDPWHTAWGEKPWVAGNEAGSLPGPACLAAGDLRLFVRAGNRLLDVRAESPAPAPAEIALPAGTEVAGIVALAALGDAGLVAAWPTRVAAYRTPAAGACTPAWSSAGFSAVSGLAATDHGVVVADRGASRLLLLDPATGRELARVGADAVPGGLQPGAVAARGAWLVVADEPGQRLLRFRVRGP